jgi:hypothetical protein
MAGVQAEAKHALARSEIAEDGRADRRHAAPDRARRLGPLEGRELGLEHLDRRIVAAAVDRRLSPAKLASSSS